MFDNGFKEVLFDKYCETCTHKDVNEVDEPCNTCLEWPMRDGTEKPYSYEASEVKQKGVKNNG